MNRLLICWLAAALVVVFAACGRGSTQTNGTSPLTIAVIPKGTSHVFWQSIHAGANQAAKELGVEVIWRGPLREDDRDSQVSEVEGFVTPRRVRHRAGAARRERAGRTGRRRGATQDPGRDLRLGAEGQRLRQLRRHRQPGRRPARRRAAGEAHARHRARSILLRYAEGHDSTAKREDGFLDAMKAHSGIQVVSSNQYVGADVEGAYKRAEAILSSYKKPDGSLSIDGIFCPNESSTFATLRVLQDNGWAGKVRFVGFDSSENMVKGLRDRALDGLVVQDPGQDGLPRGEDHRRAHQGTARRAPDRHRRPRRHARQYGAAGDQGAAASRSRCK